MQLLKAPLSGQTLAFLRAPFTSEICTHEGSIDAKRKEGPSPHRELCSVCKQARSCACGAAFGQRPGGRAARAHADSLSSAPVEAAPSPAQEVVGATPPAAALPAPAVLLPAPAHTAVESAAAEATADFLVRPTSTDPGGGRGRAKVGMTLYGFVEADFIFDTTRSYGDATVVHRGP